MSEPTEDQNPADEQPSGEFSSGTHEDGADQRKTSSRADDPTKIRIEKNPVVIISGAAGFFKSILSLRDGTYDIKGIIANVKDGIVFKGYNVWILMCSILVASVGLNMGSTAVIIGAMLISPLMGPIRGIGFGVGTNDFKLLLESLKNFGITVGISLLISFLYFLVTPLHETTSELFGRTEPSFLDVIIAFFGGLAGVIAMSKNKADTVIPGVAIATALMPPLCTAGYGLANGEWVYFLGAGYLFLINSLLIATSTYIFIRYLKFPKKEYLTPKIEKRVKGYTLAFIIVVVAPSGYLFYRMTQISIFESNADKFVEEVIMSSDNSITVDPTYNFDWGNSFIELDIANFYADEFVVDMWKRRMNTETYGLEGVGLFIKQGKDYESKMKEMFDEYDQSDKGTYALSTAIVQYQTDIRKQQDEIDFLKENPTYAKDPLEMEDLLAGFKVDYPEYQNIYISRSFALDPKGQLDTVYVMSVLFKDEVKEQVKPRLNSKISRRLKLELERKSNVVQDSIRVIEM